MRLSLQKAAQADMGGAAYRKSGLPIFFVPHLAERDMGHPSYPAAFERIVQKDAG
jgi:hypothetical protein